jgi:hypothetical protein
MSTYHFCKIICTNSGGRDLSGNKRTNKQQSSDQKFESSNAALRLSCLKGYPVRVVRYASFWPCSLAQISVFDK